MSQSATIVKSYAEFSEQANLTGLSYQPSSELWDYSKPLMVSPESLTHPFFALLKQSKSKNDKEVSVLGQNRNQFLLNFAEKCNWSDLSLHATESEAQTFLDKKLYTSDPLRFQWDRHVKDIPIWLLNALSDPKRKASIWFEVPYAELPFLTEPWCALAVQLGWSWWLTPPRLIGELNNYFELSKPLWRFWFTSPISDQWVWPWCNVVAKQTVKTLNPLLLFPRTWIADSRHKNCWMDLEQKAWEHLRVVVGGDNLLHSFCHTAVDLVRQGVIVVSEK